MWRRCFAFHFFVFITFWFVLIVAIEIVIFVWISKEDNVSRAVVVQAFKICFSGFLIGFLLYRIGIQSTLEQLLMANVYGLVGALVLFTASHLLGSYGWWLLLRGEDMDIPWKKAVSFYFIGLFFNNFFISSFGGDVFRMVDVRRYSKNGTGAVSTVFLDRFVGLFTMSGLAAMAAIGFFIKGTIHPNLRWPLSLLAIFWIFVIFFLFNKRFARPFAWIIRKIVPESIGAKTKEVYRKIHDFGHRKNLLTRVVGISLIVQSARIMTHYLLARSLGVGISAFYFFFIIPIVAIMASLPISIGGIGLREQTGVFLFGSVGVAALPAFSMGFLSYVIAIASSLPGGLFFAGRKNIGSKDT